MPFAEFVVGFRVFSDLKLCKTVWGPGVLLVRGLGVLPVRRLGS